MQQRGLFLQYLKQTGIQNHAVLHNLRPSLTINAFRESQKKGRVHNYKLRLIKCTNQVFAQRMINARFTTYCRIYLRKQRGRKLNKWNTPVICCCYKATKVT